MRTGFFPKLAWTGIRKNHRLYLPYLLSCAGMIFMYYTLHSLSCTPLLSSMAAGNGIQLTLSLGKFVIAAFSAIFLFYTNSFLIRRRFKEFGLYNILGMDKRGVNRILLWETLIVGSISLLCGLFLGVAFSKLAELGLLNMIHAEVDYSFRVPPEAVGCTLTLYALLFALILLRSLWQVRRAKPLELLRSEHAGERPPRSNWLLAIPGALLLIAAYVLAVMIDNPITAMCLFFIAVIMVIIATYLLFIAGSVTLCRLLQQNKGYYYRKNHFVSVSSMAFRMRRNGAGLASICILCTMVLVTISTTVSLYTGIEDTLRNRFPLDNRLTLHLPTPESIESEISDQFRACVETTLAAQDAVPAQRRFLRYATITALLEADVAEPDVNRSEYSLDSFGKLRSFFFISAADYADLTGEQIALAENCARIHTLRCNYASPTLRIGDLNLRITGTLESPPEISAMNDNTVASILLVIPDYDALKPLASLADAYGRPMLSAYACYDWNMDADAEASAAAFKEIQTRVREQMSAIAPDSACIAYSIALDRSESYAAFGGMFFLGALLSALFIFAAATIIYYKQVCEGYEDQSRFGIMRKVGMTRGDVKKSINSQVLTVFFAPLALAGLHLAFAFPMIWKILQLFSLHNFQLVLLTTAGAFLLFCALYALIYKATAGVYFRIVSASEG